LHKDSGLNTSTFKNDETIKLEKKITDPNAVPILFHEKKQLILKLLIEKEMTIIDIKNAIKMNPGTIKRHIKDLVENKLVKQSRIETNKYGIKMKYYRATAKRFIFNIEWP